MQPIAAIPPTGYDPIRRAAIEQWHGSSMARDLFHNAVREGLTNEGWTITADPLEIKFGGVAMYVDLAAEKLIAAEKNGQQIAVEIKSFVGASVLTDFHTALGQFLNYRLALEDQEPQRKLYLAVPVDTFAAFFSLPFTQAAVQTHRLNLIVYDPMSERIVQWTS